MIAAYFAELEQAIQSFPNILRSVLTKKQYNARHHPELATFPHHSGQSWRPDEPLRGEAQREHHLKECHGQLLEKQ